MLRKGYKEKTCLVKLNRMEDERFTFQAEINQLLGLIINTFYTSKDIFLREVICNGSDALDKYSHYCIVNKPVDNIDPKITIIPDKEAGIIHICDNGIGMTKEGLIQNLGTIAESGTKQFMQSIKDKNLIGQFGVGFYSTFLVADKVTVITKTVDSDFYRWESKADGEYTISMIQSRETPSYHIHETLELVQGTVIQCHLKQDCLSFLDPNHIKDIIRKHCQYITYPIYLNIEKEISKEVEEEEEEVTPTDEQPVVIEDVNEEEEKPKKMKTIKEIVKETEHVNSQKPVWYKNPTEVSEEEYHGLYKSLTNDSEDPYAYKMVSGEGKIDYKGVLYIPKRVRNNVFERGVKQNNIKLFVRKIFVTDQSETLCPEWLHFVAGLIDTQDLPLNISREMLQENTTIKILKKAVTKKSIDMLKNAMNDYSRYLQIYTTYSKNIKLGVYEETTNRERVADLLMFYSMNSPEKMISFDDYITDMADNQDKIYYITGQDTEILTSSPFLDRFKDKGYDVLFMTDPVDEYMTQRLMMYKDKRLVCITKGDVDLPDEDKEKLKERQEEFKELCDHIKNIYKDEFTDVKVSNKIKDLPCIISAPEHGFTANMERIVKAQTLGTKEVPSHMLNKKTLEINPNNEIIHSIRSTYKEGKADGLIDIIVNSALLYSGYNIIKPVDFSKRLLKIVMAGLETGNIDEDHNKPEPILSENVTNLEAID